MSQPLTLEALRPLVGSSFSVHTEIGLLPLQLFSVEAGERRGLPDTFATPLSLVFSSERTYVLQQGNYTLEHPQLGQLQLFMVPVTAPGNAPQEGSEATCNYYEIVLG